MAKWTQDGILGSIERMDDGEHLSAAILTADDLEEAENEELRFLVGQAGKCVALDFANLGENGYEAYGTCCFQPELEGDPSSTLSVFIQLADELEQTGIYDVYRIVNRINGLIPEGTFVVTPDQKNVYYRNNIPLLQDAEEEQMLENVGMRMLISFAALTQWIEVICGLNDGSMPYEECLKIIENVEKNF